MSTLHVSKDLVSNHQEFIVVYCITQLCTVVQTCPAALVLLSVLYYTALYSRANVSSCFGLARPKQLETQTPDDEIPDRSKHVEWT